VKKRMTIMLAALLLFIGSIGFVKFEQIRAAIAAGAAYRPPPEAVTTIVTRVDEWPQSLSAIGSVEAVQGVTVSADLPGIVERIAFESGHAVDAGETLVELDISQERAQLAAAEAQRDLLRLNLERSRRLIETGAIAQAENDRIAAEAKQAEAHVGEIEATIARKTVRAPFAGVLGIRQVALGQYLSAGQPIVPLQSRNPIYVNFSVPQQDVPALRIGAEVRAAAERIAVDPAVGRITAINSVVDEGTRNVQVQATFENPRGRLRPGMFVDVQVAVGASQRVIALPASAIHYAPYGNSVFIVGEMKAPDGSPYRGVRQQFVKLGGARGDQVAVTSGVQAGDEVVTSGVFKLRNGAAVVVNNQVRPGNDPAPKPEES
jgi:membrane fusion protein (multidrug efflux system)